MGMMPQQGSWQAHDSLRWLGKEAPRYTSYPSAHHFGDLSGDTYGKWLATLKPKHSVGLYLHVPFCEEMCWFCGCNTHITRRYDPVESYVDRLIEEIAMIGRHLGFRPRVHGLHFGGGSPGIMTPYTLDRLMTALHDQFSIQPGAEISIELDPRRITLEKAEAYAAHGFNRVSLGVQDTQAKVQQAINRVQPIAMIADRVALLRRQGLDAIGLDLIYGLPFQTCESIQATLDDVHRLGADRISAFSYAHVPWVKKHQTLIDTAALPSIEDKAAQYLLIDAVLQAQGYVAIGIDHFAKPEDGLARALAGHTLRRNFMGYTDQPNDRLIAFGASSISELDRGLAQNIPQSTTYQGAVARGELPTKRGWTYRGDDLVRKALISELMCYFTADTGVIATAHGLDESYFDDDMTRLDEYTEAGLIEVDGRRITFVSPLKMLVRSVACVFDTYARDADGGNRYSKVA